MTKLTLEKLTVHTEKSREAMGKHAAAATASLMKKILKEQNHLRMVFAAAPSQNEFLRYLRSDEEIEWNNITAFHMDEYIGLGPEAPQLFGNYLRENLFSHVSCREVNFINSTAPDAAAECVRYEALIKQERIDIVCLGIGENGHLAFNDPPAADFNDPAFVKIVELDEPCRQQQVNDGCFDSIDRVPKRAITMTIPALLSARYLSAVVPGSRKANAVFQSLYGEISTRCPASILRTCSDAVLYLDSDSAARVTAAGGR